MGKPKSSQTVRREALKKEFWADQVAWTGDGEKGWLRAPRTLPLIMWLLSQKDVGGNFDPGPAYLELLARHKDSGIVEMGPEGDHSFAAGYTTTRGIRTWQERMAVLEKLGFIKTQPSGNTKYGHVLLVHPAIAIQKLREAKTVPDRWWQAYRAQQIASGETKYEDLIRRQAPPNVVPIKPGTASTAASAPKKLVFKKKS